MLTKRPWLVQAQISTCWKVLCPENLCRKQTTPLHCSLFVFSIFCPPKISIEVCRISSNTTQVWSQLGIWAQIWFHHTHLSSQGSNKLQTSFFYLAHFSDCQILWSWQMKSYFCFKILARRWREHQLFCIKMASFQITHEVPQSIKIRLACWVNFCDLVDFWALEEKCVK